MAQKPVPAALNHSIVLAILGLGVLAEDKSLSIDGLMNRRVGIGTAWMNRMGMTVAKPDGFLNVRIVDLDTLESELEYLCLDVYVRGQFGEDIMVVCGGEKVGKRNLRSMFSLDKYLGPGNGLDLKCLVFDCLLCVETELNLTFPTSP